MEEIWKDVKGYEGYYQISNLGRVKSLARKVYRKNGQIVNRSERILKPYLMGDGYLSLCFRVENKISKQYVHRVVAKNFLEKPDYANCVNHIDGNKQNNKLSNLEWVNHVENHAHAVRIGLINNKGENSSTAKFTNKEANLIRIFYETRRFSRKEIASLLGVSETCIAQIVSGVRYKND